MINRLIKSILVIFSVVFMLRVLTIFVADRYYSMSLAAEKGKITTDRARDLLNIAIRMDSSNADLYSRKFRILVLELKNIPKGTHPSSRIKRHDIYEQMLPVIKHCIQLCPSWPKYHLQYALTVKKMSFRLNAPTRELILSELLKAAELKPYSELHRKVYEKYRQKL